MGFAFLQKDTYYFSDTVYMGIRVGKKIWFHLIIFNFWSFISVAKLSISAQVNTAVFKFWISSAQK